MMNLRDVWSAVFSSKQDRAAARLEEKQLDFAAAQFEQMQKRQRVEQMEEDFFHPHANAFHLRDRDEEDWIPIDADSFDRMPTEETLRLYRNISRDLFRFNPHAKNIIRNFVKFINGRNMSVQATIIRIPEGVQINEQAPPGVPENRRTVGRTRHQTSAPDTGATPEEKLLIDQCNFYWGVFVKINKFHRKWKEVVKRFFRDGETFIRFFEEPDLGTLIIRFIDPNDVVDKGHTNRNKFSFGIETDEDDVEDVKAYWVDNGTPESERVPAEEVQHIKNSDSDVKRGEPILVVNQRRLRQYDTWIQDRMALNKVRASIALLRQHNAGATAVGSFVQAQKTRTDQYRGRYGEIEDVDRKRVHPGSTIDAPKGTEYKFLSPNINAPDVKDDGRNLMLSIAAGVGQPEYMVTSDASNANYSSTMIAESPAVREFEDWQDVFVEELEAIWFRLRDYLISIDLLPDEAKTVGCTVQPSKMIARDRLKDTQSNEMLLLNRVISPQNWAAREGVSYEQMMDEWRLHDETFGAGLDGHPPTGDEGGGGSGGPDPDPDDQAGSGE